MARELVTLSNPQAVLLIVAALLAMIGWTALAGMLGLPMLLRVPVAVLILLVPVQVVRAARRPRR